MTGTNLQWLIAIVTLLIVVVFPAECLAVEGESGWRDFGQLIAKLKPTYEVVLNIAAVFMLLFFVYAIIIEQAQGLDNRPNYFGIIKQLFLIFIMFNFYEPFFEASNSIMRVVSDRIFSEQEFAEFLTTIWTGIAESQNKEGGMWGMLRGGVSTFLVTLSYIVSAVSFRFLAIVRYTLLGFLYVIGPFWLAISLLPGKRETLFRFIESVLLVNAWGIVANVLLKIMFISAHHLHLDPSEDFLPVIAANLVLASLLITTPKITVMVARGEGLSGTAILESSVRKARGLATTAAAFAYARTRQLASHGKPRGVAGQDSEDVTVTRPGDPPIT